MEIGCGGGGRVVPWWFGQTRVYAPPAVKKPRLLSPAEKRRRLAESGFLGTDFLSASIISLLQEERSMFSPRHERQHGGALLLR